MTLRQILACVLLAFTSACAQFAATVPTAAPEISRPPAVTYELATQLPTTKPEHRPHPSRQPYLPYLHRILPMVRASFETVTGCKPLQFLAAPHY
ncbi:hypothetical protein EMGBS1_05810 [Chloroflexota bacterium]|nr:hypothetical protein EMGBS1_05810 [Chloroflexota bacterium]